MCIALGDWGGILQVFALTFFWAVPRVSNTVGMLCFERLVNSSFSKEK